MNLRHDQVAALNYWAGVQGHGSVAEAARDILDRGLDQIQTFADLPAELAAMIEDGQKNG